MSFESLDGTDKQSLKSKQYMVISGKELAAACKAKMAEQVKTFPEKYGRLPHLVVVLVGEDAGSVSYVTGKTKAADEVGILNTTIRKPADISEEELLKIIDDLNADDTVEGILIQLPLPKHIDSDKVIARIRQDKDVDGFHPLNVAALWQKQPCVLPCTPKGIMKLLKDSGAFLPVRNLLLPFLLRPLSHIVDQAFFRKLTGRNLLRQKTFRSGKTEGLIS